MNILVILSAGLISLFSQGTASPVVLDGSVDEVVYTAASIFAGDVESLTGVKPEIVRGPSQAQCILVGTLGVSPVLDSLLAIGKISGDKVRGRSETFGMEIVNKGSRREPPVLAVYGSDARGTAYGLMELSRRLGVSPWCWWADAAPEKKDHLVLELRRPVISGPDVRYRGIFINDEDFGLSPWAAAGIDSEVADIGPNTYEKVCELLLRLKANLLWPAMHECTNSFFSYPQNLSIAGKYGVIVGTSHCEPMMRNNLDEWDDNERGEFNWMTNRQGVIDYWDERVRETAGGEYMYTLGMRGVHDSAMNGVESIDMAVSALNDIVSSQRELLAKYNSAPVETIPQVFCPYKEVLPIYQHKLNLPEDVTIIWPDDNYGYIRQLSSLEEQSRSGGAGVYYHFSYWGNPDDYLWIESTPPAQMAYELTKATSQNCNKIWVFNVGDIKPLEYEVQYALDFAWDAGAINVLDADTYAKKWASDIFGKEFADEIYQIKKEYYHLTSSIKPEHLVNANCSDRYIQKRLAAYSALESKVQELSSRLPERLRDTFFQLVEYPVRGASQLNRKTFLTSVGRTAEAEEAYQTIIELTDRYNNEISDGKWKGIMDFAPRNRPRFLSPDSTYSKPPKWTVDLDVAPVELSPEEYVTKSRKLKVVKGLGVSGAVITNYPFDGKGGCVRYRIPLKKGKNVISLRFLPTFPLQGGTHQQFEVTLDGKDNYRFNLAVLENDEEWYGDVLRNYAERKVEINSAKDKRATLKVMFKDSSIALSEIVINYDEQ